MLAGILHLSLVECELGTLQGAEQHRRKAPSGNSARDERPIIFFVAACSLSGSFYLKQSESEVQMWDPA